MSLGERAETARLAYSTRATDEQLEALRAELEKGVADLAAGRSYPWTESLFGEIRKEAQRQLDQRQLKL